MKKQIKIAIAEDHSLVRQGLVGLFNNVENMKVVLDVGDGKDLISALNSAKPDIVLLDIDMPVMGGREVIEKVNAEYPQIKVIILSGHYSAGYIVEFVNKGAASFLIKHCEFEELLMAINSVYTNGHYYNQYLLGILTRALNHVDSNKTPDFLKARLTGRESEILELIQRSKSSAEIADTLYISIRTVEGHRFNIMKKTGTKNLAGLLAWANKNILPTTT